MDLCVTTSLISSLDVIVSVDTMVAHLAGALGKKVYLLLHTEADWRQLKGREDSPCYPTVSGSGANLKGSASGGNGLDDRTGLRTGTLQGSAFRPRDNCPVRAVVPDIQAQLP